MQTATNFTTLKKGQNFIISELIGDDETVSRLYDMGFFRGQQVEYLGKGPFGGAYLFRAATTLFALRETEAECLQLQPL